MLFGLLSLPILYPSSNNSQEDDEARNEGHKSDQSDRDWQSRQSIQAIELGRDFHDCGGIGAEKTEINADTASD